MRAFTKSAIVAVATTVACTMPLGVAAAQTSPFGSLGSLGSSDPGTEEPGEVTPLVSLSKATDLVADGETITVTGSGFSGAGAGIYVGLIQDSKYSATDSTAWMTTKWLEATDIVGGAWTADIDVAAVKGDSNCLENTCSIYTVAAHGSPDRTQDTQTPVSFAAPVVVPAGPAVTISKTTGLTNDEEITVTGTGFGREGQRIYVGLAQVDKYSGTNSSAFHSTEWIKAAQIVDGGFTTTLKATAIKGDANCYENACSIFTLADHNTIDDRSQDTQTPVTFAPPVVVPTGPAVTANKTTNLTVGETITVSGTGFEGAAAGTGLYYGIVQDDQFSTTNAGAWITTGFITKGQIVGGAWTATINATAVNGVSNCFVNACSIYTVMAHGSTDRSQDTKTPITFTAPAAAPVSAPVVDAPEIQNVASVQSDAGEGPPVAPLAIGGVIAAGLAVTALRRRS
ncbi:hypothetical protein AB4Z09_00850 [Rhodococcus sp. TAF43]|uniref:hypothetical protein n=1 Tax=unclassified Rhodococcus (in: high G+C Gram-positive bacteria) TaxID=192944 RepID=UPI0015824ACC|nr:hypothetical protein [Rhodococcus sp. W8901]QKT11151.1 hypothetical protein HUN07_10840 [Rhodococcus sp. W8901]